jgi:hypothetical protein
VVVQRALITGGFVVIIPITFSSLNLTGASKPAAYSDPISSIQVKILQAVVVGRLPT